MRRTAAASACAVVKGVCPNGLDLIGGVIVAAAGDQRRQRWRRAFQSFSGALRDHRRPVGKRDFQNVAVGRQMYGIARNVPHE